ncbi:MAG: hypothetical protein HRU19_30845 [Pseudobacteriovorax sp.]|nr:hypothetical protein [Pseudobacteriovorax sp.]
MRIRKDLKSHVFRHSQSKVLRNRSHLPDHNGMAEKVDFLEKLWKMQNSSGRVLTWQDIGGFKKI